MGIKYEGTRIVSTKPYKSEEKEFDTKEEAMAYVAEMPAGGMSFKQGDKVRLIWPRSAMVTMEEGA